MKLASVTEYIYIYVHTKAIETHNVQKKLYSTTRTYLQQKQLIHLDNFTS